MGVIKYAADYARLTVKFDYSKWPVLTQLCGTCIEYFLKIFRSVNLMITHLILTPETLGKYSMIHISITHKRPKNYKFMNPLIAAIQSTIDSNNELQNDPI